MGDRPTLISDPLVADIGDPAHVVAEKMALRLEHYIRSGEPVLDDAMARCASCPFRGMPRAEQADCALVPAQDWPCHTDEYQHCAGHASAIRRFGPSTPEKIRAHAAHLSPTPVTTQGGGL